MSRCVRVVIDVSDAIAVGAHLRQLVRLHGIPRELAEQMLRVGDQLFAAGKLEGVAATTAEAR